MNKKAVTISIVILFLAVLRFAILPSAAEKFINGKINAIPDIRGSVSSVGFHILRGGISLRGIKIAKKDSASGKYQPFLEANEIDSFIYWRALLHGEVVANVRVSHPNLILEKTSTVAAPAPKGNVQKVPATKTPFKVNSFRVQDGEIHYRDLTTQPKAQLYVSQIDAEIDNVTNSRKLSDTLFATFDVKAFVMDSGKVHLTGKLNPTTEPPEFKLNVELTGLDLAKLTPELTAQKDIQIKKGNLDLASEVAEKNNKIDGYIKPVITDLQVSDLKKDLKKGVGHALKEQALDLAGKILKNQPKDEQAARIPFHGKLDDPKVSVGAAIGSTLHNIFIQALTPNLEHSITIAKADQQRR